VGIVVHYHPAIPWHVPFAEKLVNGLRKKRIDVKATSNQIRVGGLPVLLGTTLWRAIEQDGGEYILVDRCHYGDTNEWVSLCRNGRGYRAQWSQTSDPSRWEKYNQPILPWRKDSRLE